MSGLWEQRNYYNKWVRAGGRRQIWEELQRRYHELPNSPIKVSLPRDLHVDTTLLKKQLRAVITEHSNWPSYVIEWHMRNLRITRTDGRSIRDSLSNMNKPWRPRGKCTCDHFVQQLRVAGCGWCPPVTDGHVFFTGREYKGPHRTVLNVANVNMPTPTSWDLRRAWNQLFDDLPIQTVQQDKRAHMLKAQRRVFNKRLHDRSWPTTRDVYATRKVLEGLVIGPLDKNDGELWCCCPCLYDATLERMYSAETGYEEVHPRKLTPYQLRKHGRTGISSYIMSDTLAKRADQRGQPGDIIRAWRHLCKAKGWQRFGAFKAKSGFNIPYVLFKAKNVLDPATRAAKWHKARPISPATRHPMRTMLGKAGRAWYFLAHNFPGERFHIPNTGDIPTFLRQAVRRVRGSDKADIRVFDIEGCFPSMPKDAIRIAMRDLAARFRTLGHSGVFIPQARTKRCSWQAPRPHSRGTWMTFAELIDILEFSLDNTLIRMPDGRLLKQVLGIPMGDPLSPGMCIGTCAWMEAEWLAGMRASTKHFFKAARYMDDILMIMASPRYWDQERFLRDFTASECYWAPLKLEPCDGDVFLETEFSQTMSGRVRCRLKNVNSDTTRVWRYHDYRSHLDYATKRAVLLSTLRKVDRMCSDESMRLESAVTKCKEFLRLGYPEGIIRYMCALVARDTRHMEWLEVRRHLN